MPAHPETSLMLKALLGLRLDTDRLLPFLQMFSDRGYSHITLHDLVDISFRKVGITSEDISRLRDTADLHPEMKKAEFARYLKVSRQTIYNWMDDGLKWIIEINRGQTSHSDYFRAIARYITKAYGIEPDKSGKDIARACFLPHDPGAFINPNYR